MIARSNQMLASRSQRDLVSIYIIAHFDCHDHHQTLQDLPHTQSRNAGLRACYGQLCLRRPVTRCGAAWTVHPVYEHAGQQMITLMETLAAYTIA